MAADKILVLLAVGILAFLSGCGEKDGKTRRISCLDDLNEPKCTIACMTDIQATIESKKRLPKATYQEYTLPADCYAALSSGRAAAVVYDRSALENVVLDYPDFVLLPENIATGHIAVVAAKGSRKLMSRINDYIRRFRADGTYAKMYDRWIRSTSHEMPEIGRPVKPEGRLVIGVDAENPPTSYVQNGQVTGYDVEFSRRLALDLNMTVEFKSIPYDGLVAALDPTMVDEVLHVISDLGKTGITMVIVTHEMRFARDVSSRVFYMDEGVVYESGAPEQVFGAPKRPKTVAFVNRLDGMSVVVRRGEFDALVLRRPFNSMFNRYGVTADDIVPQRGAALRIVRDVLLKEAEVVDIWVGVSKGTRQPEAFFTWEGNQKNPLTNFPELEKYLRTYFRSYEFSVDDDNRSQLRLIGFPFPAPS